MIKIGDFSKIGRVPVSALRYYADQGLLLPARVDPFTGYRYYTLDQLPRLHRILALKDLGLSLEQVAQVLQDNPTAEQLRGMLALRKAELRQQLQAAEAQLVRVEARLRHIEQEHTMPTHDIVIKSIDAMPVLSLRENAPTPESVGALLGEACGAVMQSGQAFGGAPLVIFHDPEFKPENLDVEVVIPLPGPGGQAVPLDGGRQLAAGRLGGVEAAACLLHAGPFDTIAQSYEALGQWIELNGYQIAGPPREVYLRAPDDDGGALTEIQWPVARA
jgi:DNA-binding transcriptional MerR regulator